MRQSGKLTERALKPRERPFKVGRHGKGLFALVQPNGALWWRFRCRWAGRERLLSMGTYPDTCLKLARDKLHRARQQLTAGIDPSTFRKTEKAEESNTFEAIARDSLKLDKKMKATTVA